VFEKRAEPGSRIRNNTISAWRNGYRRMAQEFRQRSSEFQLPGTIRGDCGRGEGVWVSAGVDRWIEERPGKAVARNRDQRDDHRWEPATGLAVQRRIAQAYNDRGVGRYLHRVATETD